MHKPIFLVGMPGAGKTTVGRKLSVALDMPFFDLDEYLEVRENDSIRNIFTKRGEAYFREAETAALRELAAKAGGAVVATGGGAPCFNDNMAFMTEVGTTVYLKVPSEILAERLGHGRDHRPLVAGKTDAEIEKFVTETLTKRLSFYQNAHITYQSNTRDVTELCSLIKRLETIC